MAHLSPDDWRRIIRERGTSSVGETRHLDERCDLCDAVAAEDLLAPGLELVVDMALAMGKTSVSFADGRRLVELEERVLAGRGQRVSRGGWSARRRAAVAAAAAGAAAAAVLLFAPVSLESSRHKGSDVRPRPQPRLVAFARDTDRSLSPVSSGRSYASSSELYFTFDLPAAGFVHLARVADRQPPELVYPPRGEPAQRLDAGLHPLAVGGVVNAYSLQGLEGPQRFVLLVSTAGPLDDATVTAAVMADSGAFARASVDVVVE